jgi:hypothetical protein
MGKREPQIILKTDERSTVLELRCHIWTSRQATVLLMKRPSPALRKLGMGRVV